MPDSKKPITNCHTHIFIGESVPPYLAKTFLIYPLYKLVNIGIILKICRWWFLNKKTSPRQWKHKGWFKKMQEFFVAWRTFIHRYLIIDRLITFINVVIVYHAIFYFSEWVLGLFIRPDSNTEKSILSVINWLKEKHLLWVNPGALVKITVTLFAMLFIEYGRKLMFFLLKKLWSFLSILPNKKTIEFIGRYVNIGRFAYYRKQAKLFDRLKDQYPSGTRFIILPMDMEFMEAGKIPVAGNFETQMRELAQLKIRAGYKDLIHPFVFADPRRTMVGTKPFFAWEHDNKGNVMLQPCFIKEYIEQLNFSGFKIYPALGYYPFDETLLPLWKYAADKKLPVLTHTIRGTIYYRGAKRKEWNHHPVFEQINARGKRSKLLLPELKNIEFINNFTHPLNYLCLVEERLLRLVVGKASEKIKALFGYNGEDYPMNHDLSHLKLCFGHFGGDDEWKTFFEKDRDNYTSQIETKPATGLAFLSNGPIGNSMNRLEQIWKDVDWYSIICSMMLQYKNLYADISYILHDEEILPLLKKTLQHPELSKKVLYGTDFYVVRNHKSEKEMLADMQAGLSEKEFDQIARDNPAEFLNV